MAKNSGITWTDHTWNPWQGCQKVSPGCAHCYMYRDKARYGQNPEMVVRSKPATFNAPLRWRDPAKVFVCSWSDFFIEDADEWRDDAWKVITGCPHLTFLLLTKRAEVLPFEYPENVWVGVTAENQEQFENRMLYLSEVHAAVKFVSVEPMLESISIYNYRTDIDWIICGGESGPNAREMNPEWARSLKWQCADNEIPFFMKQMSGKGPIPDFLQGREFPINCWGPAVKAR